MFLQAFAVGDIAYGPMGGWNAGTVEEGPFEFEYIPFPGSSDAADNQTFFGKVDIAGESGEMTVSLMDVADTVLWLASPGASKISGQAIAIDGHTETNSA